MRSLITEIWAIAALLLHQKELIALCSGSVPGTVDRCTRHAGSNADWSLGKFKCYPGTERLRRCFGQWQNWTARIPEWKEDEDIFPQ